MRLERLAGKGRAADNTGYRSGQRDRILADRTSSTVPRASRVSEIARGRRQRRPMTLYDRPLLGRAEAQTADRTNRGPDLSATRIEVYVSERCFRLFRSRKATR